MDYVFILAGSFVTFVALFKRALLNESQSFGTILAISLALFIGGIALHFTDDGRHFASGALLAPLFSLGLYRYFRRIFVNRIKHEPRDTFMDWTAGMAADRLFNVVYFTVSALLTVFSAVGMEELAKLGW